MKNQFKKAFAISALAGLSVLVGGTNASRADSTTWYDSFGKVWRSYESKLCNPSDRFATCTRFIRDQENTLGCGALPVESMEVQVAAVSGFDAKWYYSATVFSKNPECTPSYWRGAFNRSANRYEGMVVDATGRTTPFRLSRNPGGDSIPGGYDPSRPRRK